MAPDDPDATAVLEHGDEWVHRRTGERLATGLSADERTIADVLDPDAYSLEWTCPVCGETWLGDEIDHEDDEFARDGTDTVHVPCADGT
ncbi:MAG: hypothetical protein ABEH40_06475 [Haloferacaceae archaeon]